MTSEQFNAAVRAAARNQPLGGTRRGGSGEPWHHWKVRVEKADPSAEGNQYRVLIGPGAVNDSIAAITYLATGDPRQWEPATSPATATVDRLLTEPEDPPHLLIETPLAADLGDFERVPDDERRPSAFRSKADWEKQLWQCSVFVSATPANYGRVENRLHFPLPKRNTRFRVAARSRMPNTTFGVQLGGNFELARLYLLRDPTHAERDELLVQQLCFWSLWTANVSPYLDFDVASPELPTFGVGAGLADSFAQGQSEISDIITGELFQRIAADFESAAHVEFWTA